MFLSAFAAAAAVAITPGSQLDRDIHCLAAIATAGGMAKTEEEKNAMMIGAFYYIGKIDGEAPGIDLQGPLVAIITAPDYGKTQFPADMKRCGGEMSVRGKTLVDLGSALTKGGH